MDAYRSVLEVRDAGTKGKGVYCKALIPATTVIFELGGKIVTNAELSTYSVADIQNFFQIGPNYFLSKSGDLDDYMNHSCNPNCGLRVVGGRALVQTLYQINPGDEITWDYSTTSTDTHDTWKMNCSCGDFNCRKIISGFSYLSDEIKKKYIDLNVVPTYQLKA